VDAIPEGEIFHLAITAYALTYTSQGASYALRKLFQQTRNDCEHRKSLVFIHYILSAEPLD
jgi:hypothetical protein